MLLGNLWALTTAELPEKIIVLQLKKDFSKCFGYMQYIYRLGIYSNKQQTNHVSL